MDTPGVQAIRSERERQISEEGFTAEHDSRHSVSILMRAAACYATPASRRATVMRLADGTGDRGDRYREVPVDWPWHPDDWKPTTPRRDLVKAGALIAAAIDRLDAGGLS